MPSQPEPLKVFLQHRIKSIISKEWWDFVVNVNNMNSDHASLLYSVANLCPSFQNFLRTRDKELNYILKKRPQIKPRIFSGSERSDIPLVPPAQSDVSKNPKKSCSAELDQILNELYPNERSIIKRKPRTYGPISKQKRMQNLKKREALQSQKENTAEDTNSTLLSKLLRDETPNTVKKSSNSSNNEGNHKLEYTISNYDANKNKLSLNVRKVMKKVTVKKKIMTYIDNNDKSRTKYILESETPELKRELIKKYKIKKCNVVVQKLTPKNIKELISKIKNNQAPQSSCLTSEEPSKNVPVGSDTSDSPVSVKLNLGKSISMTIQKNKQHSARHESPTDRFDPAKPEKIHSSCAPLSSISKIQPTNSNTSSVLTTITKDGSELKTPPSQEIVSFKDKPTNTKSDDSLSTCAKKEKTDKPKSFNASCPAPPEEEVTTGGNGIKVELNAPKQASSVNKGVKKDPDQLTKENPLNGAIQESIIAYNSLTNNKKVSTSVKCLEPPIQSDNPQSINTEDSFKKITPNSDDLSKTKREKCEEKLMEVVSKPDNVKASIKKELSVSNHLDSGSTSKSNFKSEGACNEKESDNHNPAMSPKFRFNQKENVAVNDKSKSKELSMELKTVYCHGGIVPLGKKSSSILDKTSLEKNKHFLSLKEKKVKEALPDISEAISPLKEKNVKSVAAESKNESSPLLIKNKDLVKTVEKPGDPQNVSGSKMEEVVGSIKETCSVEPGNSTNVPNICENTHPDKNEHSRTPEHSPIPSAEGSELCTMTANDLEEEEDTEKLIIDESANGDDNECLELQKGTSDLAVKETEDGDKDDVILVEAPHEVIEIDSQDEDTEPFFENTRPPVKVKIEQIELSDLPDGSADSVGSKQHVTVLNIEEHDESVVNLNEPLPKRPRLEINLATMQFDNKCKVCNAIFNSHAEWLEHFENNVPKCTPNLQVRWDKLD